MTKLSDYVVRFLEKQGIKHVFMLPGGGCMHLVDSFGSSKEISFVANLHEQAVSIAAEAYAQYTGGFGLALVTTGPGGTNAITGLVGAWNDSTPVIFLSGQVKRADLMTGRGVRMMGPQEVDIISLVKPVTKYAFSVHDPATIRHHLEKAVWLAKSGRPGPVWLDFPLDVQAAQVDEAALAPFVPPVDEKAVAAARGSLVTRAKEALAALRVAERPVLFAGNGIRLAGGLDVFQKLVARLQIPVLTTWKSLDFLADDHPLFAGRPGGVGSRGANFTQQNADWILVAGARLDLPQIAFNPGNFARAAKRVIVDIDPAEIAKLGWKDAIEVAGDAREFMEELLRQAEGMDLRPRDAWLARVRAWKKKYPVVLPEYWEEKDGVNTYALVDAIAEAMTPADLFVPGSSGACSEVSMQAFKAKAGLRVFNTEGLGPMGFGIPAALGGCVASGGKRTVSIDGDGGFHMNSQELETVRRLGLPIKFFVLNNDGYGSIKATQRNYFQGRLVASDPTSGLTLPDTQKIAAAYGLKTAEIRETAGLREKVRAVLATPGAIVCEVFITKSQATAPRVSSKQLADGTMVSAPMEDLFPFLDRAEFAANMIVPPLKDGA